MRVVASIVGSRRTLSSNAMNTSAIRLYSFASAAA